MAIRWGLNKMHSKIRLCKFVCNHRKEKRNRLRFILLSHLDSNQDKQIQNLLCYHYTIGQFFEVQR